jgi:Icc protein
MPLHILPRRQFLASTAGFAALAVTRLTTAGDDNKTAARFALISDTHIAADKNAVLRDVNMADNLARVWEEVLAAQPAASVVHGDVALLDGQPGDYKTVAELLLPAGKVDMPLHFMLGNHDNRATFRRSLKDHAASPLESHCVAIVEAGPVNWFMLDSLDQVNKAPGVLGQAQLEWLAAALDAHADKPAIISVHHNLIWPTSDPNFKHGALQDTVQLFDILSPRKHVKAIFFGHSHDWSVKEREGIHLVNLPPTAYVFAKGKPNGWVLAEYRDRGMTLVLNSLDRTHKQHGEKHELAWR